MKTSSSQFELMVSFMEEHGDLSKQSSDTSGRLKAMRNWERITNLLNSDGGGDTKSTEKWKKVWSDFKNNTKKKAVRLHKAATGTGGDPAVLAKLTDLEKRVLKLVGVQVTTGLPAEEAELSQQTANQPRSLTSPQLMHLESQVLHSVQPAALTLNIVKEEDVQAWDILGSFTQSHIPSEASSEAEVENPDTLLQARRVTPKSISRPQSASSGQTTPRRVRGDRESHHRAKPTRMRASGEPPRKRVRPAHTEEAAQHFLNADESWRNFRIQQHQDYMENKRELNRIRVMELQVQREWQALGARIVDIVEKVVDKYCSN